MKHYCTYVSFQSINYVIARIKNEIFVEILLSLLSKEILNCFLYFLFTSTGWSQ